MKYLVVLDVRSAIGSIYSSGSSDGFVSDGELRHPVLNCTEIGTDSPHYLYAKRVFSKQAMDYQSLHIPHSSVVAIHHYADTGPKPVGFVPAS